jgi:leucyl-tRNA synthetase
MHLIYARFFTKALRDMGMLAVDEPFPKLFNQGMLHGSDGNKMSKSLGNVINPIDMIDKYSADALRFNLMSLASPDSDSVWSDNGMESTHKFVLKIYNYLSEAKHEESDARLKNKINQAIKEVTDYIENFKYNLALIKIRETFEYMQGKKVSKSEIESFVKIIHPFCPHMTEELWETLGHKEFISLSSWPTADESLIDEKMDATDELLSTMISDINAVKKLAGLDKINKITLIVSAEWKYELFKMVKGELEKTRNPSEILKAIMMTDLKKHGQDITRIVPAVIKDPSKIPDVLLGQKVEMDALILEKEKLSTELKAEIEIVAAEKSAEAKAKNASPGKPAILLS